MNVNITNVNMRYDNEGNLQTVQVHFSSHNVDRSINANGYITLTAAQYAGNESVTALETIVRQEVSTKIMEQPSS